MFLPLHGFRVIPDDVTVDRFVNLGTLISFKVEEQKFIRRRFVFLLLNEAFVKNSVNAFLAQMAFFHALVTLLDGRICFIDDFRWVHVGCKAVLCLVGISRNDFFAVGAEIILFAHSFGFMNLLTSCASVSNSTNVAMSVHGKCAVFVVAFAVPA